MQTSDQGKDEDRKIAKRKYKVEREFLAVFEREYMEVKHVYWLKSGTNRQKKVKYTQKALGI